MVTISSDNIDTPEETPGVRRSSRVKFQNKPDYIPSMPGKNYKTINIQVECEETLHPDDHIFICQGLIEEVTDAASLIMKQLYLKAGMDRLKGKGQSSDKYEMEQLHFRDTFKPKHYIHLNEDQKKSILESHMFLKENRDGKIKGRTMEGGNNQREFIPKEYSSPPTVPT